MTDRVLTKLKVALEDGDFYGAHQMYLTVVNRYVKGKRIADAVALLTSGAVLLCEHKQFGSALDMATVVTKTWEDNAVPVDDTTLATFIDLLNLFNPASKEYSELVKVGIRWSSKCGNFATGEPALHHHIGITYSNAGREQEAIRHLMLGTPESATSHGVLLLRAVSRAVDQNGDRVSPSAAASVVLAPVLQYLSSVRIAHAVAIFDTFTKGLAVLEPEVVSASLPTSAATTNAVTVYNAPVLNFAQIVILCAQRGEAAAGGYKAVCQQYLTNPDPATQELIERVGQAVFNIQAPRPQGNMLQDLMSSLLGGMQQ